ncbi:type I polyketide synthase [Nocardiopsis quinghaiensis]|uniref:type I polyketide synthase n=1 Tax=Nocardiopsis quinghaiensis TaxID=464995 RepID=UPI00123966C3|nr:type I polyketide synthase [Nocardiopsis quinghaiensis]
MTTTPFGREPAAIIGMGCRLPGHITTPHGLWEALLQGRDCVTRIPARRWKVMVGRLHPDQAPDQPFPAGVVDIDAFDHAFFGISADEATEMDPQQKLLLETVHEALADASILPSSLAGSRTGVYVGAASTDQATVNFGAQYRAGVYTSSGAGMAILANRISYALDLAGPSLTIDTACSSSLTALHHAVRDLRSGEIDTALVAGTNVLTSPVITASFVEAGVLAPDGRCKPFDAQADGYVRAEGTVVLVLSRAADAQERGNRVWAHVAGTAIGHGGSSAHLLAPRIERQVSVIRQALADAALRPDQVGWVQAHGTGTKAGDRVEATALAQALERQVPVPVGSVKANLGHLEGAAGALGAMAAALAVHHGQIPPTLHHRALRSQLEGLVRVPTGVEDWPHANDREPRVAGVSSFGFGGANAHAVITNAPAVKAPPAQDPMPLPETVVVSAPTASALAAAAGCLAEQAPRGRNVGTVADTALARGSHHRHRAAVVSSHLGGMVQGLRSIQNDAPNPDVVTPRVAPRSKPRVVFVYTGHGGHHPTAGQDLMRLPVFAHAMGEARAALERQAGYEVWKPGEPVTGFADAQHCTYLVQVGLTALMAERGILPDVVLGHSVGEIAAAHTAGVLRLDAAARVLAHRSSLLSGLSGAGGLLAVRASAEQVTDLVADYDGRLSIASYSAPTVQVIAGPTTDLGHFQERLTAHGIWCKPVADAIPAHSAAVDPIVPTLREALAGLVPHPPRTVIVSTAHPDHDPDAPGLWSPAYWADQARRPVRFTDALHTAAQTVRDGSGHSVVFVEIGPRALLIEHIVHTLNEPTVAITCDSTGLARAVGELYTHGITPTGPVEQAHPSLAILPGWDHTSSSRPEGAEQVAVPAPDQVEAHLTDEIARLTPLPEGLDLASSWTDLGLESYQLLQLTSRLRRIPPWRGVDVQVFLPHRSWSAVASGLTALLNTDQTISDEASSVLP